MTLATVIFICSLLSIAGAFFWKQYLVSAQEQYKRDLVVREQQFNIDLIRQLKAESTKINLAKQLLNTHIATSRLFGIVSSLTAENVRFLTMDFITPSGQIGGPLQVAFSGYGKDLTTVAFQAKVLNKMEDFGLKNVVRNPIVSNPTFNQNGSISFSLTASIDAQNLAYQVNGPATTTSAAASQSTPPATQSNQ
ncbi:MAG: hypothetical protein JWO00_262 [Candidatus Parcubacteria bacterium]|nr:hypothetical protein [Candidatus Parcubacteria bacterium]